DRAATGADRTATENASSDARSRAEAAVAAQGAAEGARDDANEHRLAAEAAAQTAGEHEARHDRRVLVPNPRPALQLPTPPRSSRRPYSKPWPPTDRLPRRPERAPNLRPALQRRILPLR
ncbi:hypothetical protein GS888_24755, partial [Rhodococcus hoagii]|nr:hypothetical protein [Prescottella equi]